MNKGSSLYKTAGILAIIFGVTMCMGFILVIPALFGIAMIFGGVSFMKYADMSAKELQSKNILIICWIVLFFVFGGVITGVLALTAYVDSKENFDYNNDVSVNIEDNDVVSKLERIAKLHDEGLLTDEEYKNLKEEIVNKK